MRRVLKTVAWSVLLCFSINTCVYADPGLAWRLRVRSEHGRIKERSLSGDGRTVVIIEDAHTSVEAQKNIAALLSEIDPQIKAGQTGGSPIETGLQGRAASDQAASLQLGIEGATGALDPNGLASFPVRETKEKVLTDFVAEGKISGAEYYAFTAEEQPSLFGLEEPDTYMRNHALFTETLPAREALQKWIDAALVQIAAPAANSDDPRFSEIYGATREFHANTRSFDEHILFLAREAEAAGLDLSDLSAFCALAEIRQIEATIDPERLSTQIETLSEAYARAHPDRDTDRERSQDYQYLRALIRSARERDIPEREYTFIEKKSRAAFLLQTLDYAALIRECDELATRLLLSCASDEREKELIRLERSLRRLARLIRLEAQPEEVRYFRQHTDELIAHVQQAATRIPNVPRLPVKDTELNALFQQVEQFYALAEERNEIFIERTIEALDAEGTHEAVIISGGYHTGGLSEILKAKGIGYVVLTPHVSGASGLLDYKELMLSTRDAYTDFISPGLHTLATIRSCWPIYQDRMRSRADGRAFQRVVGAEFFAEDAARRVTQDGSIRLSNLQYKESLRRAGWPMADLYDLRAIYEIGEELGLVEVRVTESGSIYKSFRPEAAQQTRLLSENKKRLLEKVGEYLDRHLGRETFATTHTRSLSEELRLVRTELARIKNEDDARGLDLFIRTLLERLPSMPALEITLALSEKEKEDLMRELFPRFDRRREEVRDLLDAFSRANPSRFDLERSDLSTIGSDLRGFIESHLLYWLTRELYHTHTFSDNERVSAPVLDEATAVATEALLAFLSERYDPVRYEETFLFLVSELRGSASQSGYFERYEISFHAGEPAKNSPDYFQFIPAGSDFFAQQKMFLVYPLADAELARFGITHPVDVRSTALFPRTHIRRWSDIVRPGNAGVLYEFARDLRCGALAAAGLRDTTGRIVIDERLRDISDPARRELLRQVLLHELRGHFVIGHLRKYEPLLFQRLTDVLLDRTDLARYEGLLRSVTKLAGLAEAPSGASESPETVLARSALFGARSSAGAAIGIDRARLTEEILAYWQQIRHARRPFVHPRALFEEADTHAEYESAARALAQTVNAIFEEHRHASGEDLIKKADFDMSWAEIFTLDPTGIEPMPICWARDLEATIKEMQDEIGEDVFNDYEFKSIFNEKVVEIYNKEHNTSYTYQDLKDRVIVPKATTHAALAATRARYTELIFDAEKELVDELMGEIVSESLGGLDYDELLGFQDDLAHYVTQHSLIDGIIPEANREGKWSLDDDGIRRRVAEEIKSSDYYKDNPAVSVEKIMDVLSRKKVDDSLKTLTRRLKTLTFREKAKSAPSGLTKQTRTIPPAEKKFTFKKKRITPPSTKTLGSIALFFVTAFSARLGHAAATVAESALFDGGISGAVYITGALMAAAIYSALSLIASGTRDRQRIDHVYGQLNTIFAPASRAQMTPAELKGFMANKVRELGISNGFGASPSDAEERLFEAMWQASTETEAKEAIRTFITGVETRRQAEQEEHDIVSSAAESAREWDGQWHDAAGFRGVPSPQHKEHLDRIQEAKTANNRVDLLMRVRLLRQDGDLSREPSEEEIEYIDRIMAEHTIEGMLECIKEIETDIIVELPPFLTDFTEQAIDSFTPALFRNKIAQDIKLKWLNPKGRSQVLVGESGVGKTAIAKHLALEIAKGESGYSELNDYRIVSLDVTRFFAASLDAATASENIKTLCDAVQKYNEGKVILFIDECHLLHKKYDFPIDFYGMIKEELGDTSIKLLLSSTPFEYKNTLEKDMALDRRIAPVQIRALSADETVRLLWALKEYFEREHPGVELTYEALRQIVRYCEIGLKNRYFPDKAVEIVHESMNRVAKKEETVSIRLKTVKKDMKNTLSDLLRLRTKGVTTLNDRYQEASYVHSLQKDIKEYKETEAERQKGFSKTVALDDILASLRAAGVPRNVLRQRSEQHIKGLRYYLASNHKGQEKVIDDVCKAIQRRYVFKGRKEPIYTGLFAGTTGTGKSEMARLLAEYLFDDEESIIQFDCNEVQTKWKILGPDPGYIGSDTARTLAEEIRKRNGYAVVRFDEVEKMPKDVLDIVLGIFNNGYLIDSRGRKVDCSNLIFIMTSNIGTAPDVLEAEGLTSERIYSMDADERETYFRRQMKNYFAPEFLGRLSGQHVFHPLTPDVMRQIVRDITLPRLAREYEAEQGIELKSRINVINRYEIDAIDPRLCDRLLSTKMIIPYTRDTVLCRWAASITTADELQRALKKNAIDEQSHAPLSAIFEKTHTRDAGINAVIDVLMRGYDISAGGRGLHRAISTLIEDPLSEKILEASMQKGDSVSFDVYREEIDFDAILDDFPPDMPINEIMRAAAEEDAQVEEHIDFILHRKEELHGFLRITGDDQSTRAIANDLESLLSRSMATEEKDAISFAELDLYLDQLPIVAPEGNAFFSRHDTPAPDEEISERAPDAEPESWSIRIEDNTPTDNLRDELKEFFAPLEDEVIKDDTAVVKNVTNILINEAAIINIEAMRREEKFEGETYFDFLARVHSRSANGTRTKAQAALAEVIDKTNTVKDIQVNLIPREAAVRVEIDVPSYMPVELEERFIRLFGARADDRRHLAEMDKDNFSRLGRALQFLSAYPAATRGYDKRSDGTTRIWFEMPLRPEYEIRDGITHIFEKDLFTRVSSFQQRALCVEKKRIPRAGDEDESHKEDDAFLLARSFTLSPAEYETVVEYGLGTAFEYAGSTFLYEPDTGPVKAREKQKVLACAADLLHAARADGAHIRATETTDEKSIFESGRFRFEITHAAQANTYSIAIYWGEKAIVFGGEPETEPQEPPTGIGSFQLSDLHALVYDDARERLEIQLTESPSVRKESWHELTAGERSVRIIEARSAADRAAADTRSSRTTKAELSAEPSHPKPSSADQKETGLELVIGADMFEKLQDELFDENDFKNRERAASTLGLVNDPRAATLLWERFAVEPGIVVLPAIGMSLSALRRAGIVPERISFDRDKLEKDLNRSNDDEDWKIRYRAAITLGYMNDAHAARLLWDRLNVEDVRDVSLAISESLFTLRDADMFPEGISFDLEDLKKDLNQSSLVNHEQIRCRAATKLGHMIDTRAAALLWDRFAVETDFYVLCVLGESLDVLREAGIMPEGISFDIKELEKALNHDNKEAGWKIKYRAAITLGYVKDARAARLLWERSAIETDRYLLRAIRASLFALRRAGIRPEGIGVNIEDLEKELNISNRHEEWIIRYRAAIRLGHLNGARAARLLWERFTIETDTDVLRALWEGLNAVLATRRIDDANNGDRIIQVERHSQSASEPAREAATSPLGAQDPVARIASSAPALEMVVGADTLDTLRDELGNKDHIRGRLSAASKLGLVNDTRAAALLWDRFAVENNTTVFLEIAESLFTLREAGIVPEGISFDLEELKEDLNHFIITETSWMIRTRAAMTLGYVNDERAIRLLWRQLGIETDPSVLHVIEASLKAVLAHSRIDDTSESDRIVQTERHILRPGEPVRPARAGSAAPAFELVVAAETCNRLRNMLHDDNDMNSRRLAAIKLGQVNDPRAATLLWERLGIEPDTTVVRAIGMSINALRSAGHAPEGLSLNIDELEKESLDFSGSHSWHTRYCAAITLGYINDARAARILWEQLGTENNSDVLRAIGASLCALRSAGIAPEGISLDIEELEKDLSRASGVFVWQRKYRAAIMLGYLNDPRAPRLLWDLLTEETDADLLRAIRESLNAVVATRSSDDKSAGVRFFQTERHSQSARGSVRGASAHVESSEPALEMVVGADTFEKLQDDLRNENDYKGRQRAASTLGLVNDTRAAALLWDRLAVETHADVQRAIETSLKALDEAGIAFEGISLDIEKVEKDLNRENVFSDWKTRHLAAIRLGYMNDARAPRLLWDRLDVETDRDVVRSIRASLLSLQRAGIIPEGISFDIEKVEKDLNRENVFSDRHIRCRAATQLGYMNHARAARLLWDRLAFETDATVLRAIGESLDALREAGIAPEGISLDIEEVKKALHASTGPASWRIRYRAATQLGYMNDDRAARLLWERFDVETDVYVLRAIGASFYVLRSAGIVPEEGSLDVQELEKELHTGTGETEWRTRHRAATLLGYMNDERAAQLLWEHFGVETNVHVLRAIAESLSILRKSGIVPEGISFDIKQLEEFLNYGNDVRNWKIRYRAATQLGYMNHARAARLLWDRLAIETDATVLREIGASLCALRNAGIAPEGISLDLDEVEKELRAGNDSNQWRLRYRAATQLGYMNDEPAARLLWERLAIETDTDVLHAIGASLKAILATRRSDDKNAGDRIIHSDARTREQEGRGSDSGSGRSVDPSQSASKVMPGEEPLPIEVVDAFLASLGNGLVFMNMRPVDPEKEKMINRAQEKDMRTNNAWERQRSSAPKRTEPAYEKILIITEDRDVPFSVRQHTRDTGPVLVPYVARVQRNNPFIVFEGGGASYTVWSFHDRAGNMYMSERAYALMNGTLGTEASDGRSADKTGLIGDQTRLHELSELFCYDWRHRGPGEYIKDAYTRATGSSALAAIYDLFQDDLLTREKVLEYIQHKQKARVHHLDHYYSELYEIVDTFFRTLATGEERLAQYGITRSIESFLTAQGVTDMSELTLMDIERIVKRSFLDDFLLSLKEPTEKYLLVNGSVFLSDLNYRDGKVYAKDGLGREQTAVNMWLKEQIARHKENQLMSDERLAVKVVLFLEGDSNDMDLLRAYLKDAREEIDTWAIIEDLGDTDKSTSDLARYGITQEKILGVINENRRGTFTPRDPVYDLFVGHNIIAPSAYKELDPNLKPFEIIETDGNCVRIGPSFFQAAEAICDDVLLLPGQTPLLSSRIQFVSGDVLEHMHALLREITLHNSVIRTAA